MLTEPPEKREGGYRAYLSLLRALRCRGGALGKGSGRCELQVGLSSTSLLASATRVSHVMRWHQIFNEHAAKKEEWCPPGQRALTLNWSSAVHTCTVGGKKQPKSTKKFQLQVEQIV